MNELLTIATLLTCLLNTVILLIIYQRGQSKSSDELIKETYQKQIKNYGQIVRMNEKLTREAMRNKKESKHNEKNVGQKTNLVQVEKPRRIY